MFIKIGIDLGTTNVLILCLKKGIVVNEPSVVAIQKQTAKCSRNSSQRMIGRTPDTIVADRPLKDGVIANYQTTEAMIRYFINKASAETIAALQGNCIGGLGLAWVEQV
jgi:rod shape-determining protein MreB